MPPTHFYEPFEFTHQGAEWITPPPPIGVAWNGDLVGLANPRQNWSWNTTVESNDSEIKITYNGGYAGFQLHNPTAIENGEELRLTIDRPLNLTVSVSNNSTGEQAFYPLTTGNGVQAYTVDISAFGSSNAITNIFLQNDSANPKPVFSLTQFEFRAAGKTIPLIASAEERIQDAFRTAFIWGIQNKMPMHLGEFGAYRFGDLESRVRWTTSVCKSAESYRLNWSYWELAAGFGFYDPEAEIFRLPLLQALVPDFQE